MYRPFKFKVFSKKEKKFLTDKGGSLIDWIQTYPEVITDAENFELVEYIGKKDKNGIEIYDGDILEYPSNGNKIKVFYDPYSCQYVPFGNDEWKNEGVVVDHILINPDYNSVTITVELSDLDMKQYI